MKFETTREIGIDAGHRVQEHGSKCKNLHGHRYKIEAVVVGDLQPSGEQEGMTLDFGFLKKVMMDHIDEPCDHGMILSQHDPFLEQFMPEGVRRPLLYTDDAFGAYIGGRYGKLYVVPFTPTAENLARHWYARMAPTVENLTDGLARLAKIVVHETPNCRASYPA